MNNDTTSYQLDFVIPQGGTGPAGPKGDAGAAGPQGPQGVTGPTGPAPKITIGNVTTGAPGSDAEVTITQVVNP